LEYRKKVQIESFSVGIEVILGGALEATLGAGKGRFSLEGVVGTVRDKESCEKDMVRDPYNKD
jgi:hypothetical protein